jgi:hypothetical protein
MPICDNPFSSLVQLSHPPLDEIRRLQWMETRCIGFRNYLTTVHVPAILCASQAQAVTRFWHLIERQPMIEQIRESIAQGQFEFAKHAVDQSILRRISVQELREAIADGEIIEYYPDDKYGPSCLIFGLTRARRPLHIQCSYPSRSLVKIITLYEPDPNQWIDFKVRRT